MIELKKQIKITIGLGFTSLLTGFFSSLALTDIYHLEPDVTLEWAILQVNALVFIIFAVTALITLFRALKVVDR
jgi:hypothetical protein